MLQNLLGMGLAAALGVDPRLGILAGSVALTGGPATAVAFGGTFERMGVQGATAGHGLGDVWDHGGGADRGVHRRLADPAARAEESRAERGGHAAAPVETA